MQGPPGEASPCYFSLCVCVFLSHTHTQRLAGLKAEVWIPGQKRSEPTCSSGLANTGESSSAHTWKE